MFEISVRIIVMACRGDPNDPNEPFEPPRTPKMVLKDGSVEELAPDTEDNVAHQTDRIFRNFVFHMHTNLRPEEEAVDTPPDPEIVPFDQPLGPEARIGRQLALIGDDINNRYAPEFQQMIAQLNITPDTAYEAFAGVARKLFRDGVINWGRVVTLLCFGYRMAVTVLQRGIRGFFVKIVTFMCKFIMVEKIARWIAEQGGWRAALRIVPENVGWGTVGAILGVAALFVAGVYLMTKKNP